MTANLPAASPCGATQKAGALCDRLVKIVDEGPLAVDRRLEELDREWSSGRLVKASVGVCLIIGLVLSLTLSPWWTILPALSGVVLLQYLFCKRSWLADVYKACGMRSGAQIEDERIALRVLRGDFKHLPTLAQIEDRDAVSRMEGEGGPAIETDEEKYDMLEAALVVVHTTTDVRK